MTDEFKKWLLESGYNEDPTLYDYEPYKHIKLLMWFSWQEATKQATAGERARIAGIVSKTRAEIFERSFGRTPVAFQDGVNHAFVILASRIEKE